MTPSVLQHRAPAIDELTVMPIDWNKIGPEDIKKAKAEWQSIFTP